MSDTLISKHCVPCEGGVDPLTNQREDELLTAVPEWGLDRTAVHFIHREFVCKNFKEALAFVNQVGQLAESEGHHPDITLHDYKKVFIELTTHAIDGLSENDFIMAAKINEIWQDK